MRSMKIWVISLLVAMSASTAAGSEEGVASYYADSLKGNATASGEPSSR